MRKTFAVIYTLILAALLAGCARSAPVETIYPGPVSPGASTAPAIASPYPPPTESRPTAYPAASPAPALISPYPPATESRPTAYPAASQPAIIQVTPYPDTTTGTQASGDEPWKPQPGDARLQQGLAFVDEAQVLTLESMPPQFRLAVSGNLPTPCHMLRIEIPPPNAGNRIEVRVYSVVKADMICTQVLEPFQVTVPIEGLLAGQYTFQVNGQPAGTIDVP